MNIDKQTATTEQNLLSTVFTAKEVRLSGESYVICLNCLIRRGDCYYDCKAEKETSPTSWQFDLKEIASSVDADCAIMILLTIRDHSGNSYLYLPWCEGFLQTSVKLNIYEVQHHENIGLRSL